MTQLRIDEVLPTSCPEMQLLFDDFRERKWAVTEFVDPDAVVSCPLSCGETETHTVRIDVRLMNEDAVKRYRSQLSNFRCWTEGGWKV